MPASQRLTPMFRQYHAIKRNYPDAILLFRMGDFYEMFYEDAEQASRLLELTLTARGKGTDHLVPMCGFPYHQLDAYTARLVAAGRKVAVCEQLEDPRQAKSLVHRDVVRVVTPGTLTDPEQLEAKRNVWIASLAAVAGRLGAALLDLSTGEFLAWEAEGAPWEALLEHLEPFAPREIVHPDDLSWPEALVEARLVGATLTALDGRAFALPEAGERLARQFGVHSLDGFGLRGRPGAVAAAGGLLGYLQQTQKCALEHLDRIVLHEPEQYVLLDPATRRNLEIERSAREGTRAGSLLDIVDQTQTAAGGRLLRQWLGQPLRDLEAIRRRLDAVEELVRREPLRAALRQVLQGVRDIERLTARAVTGTAHARDLLALRASLAQLPELRQRASQALAPALAEAAAALDPCADLHDLLARALADSPPAALREGGVIRDGYHEELDQLRALRRDGRAFLASLEAREREATGIANLKVRFNKVFGYYIEVSKSNLRLVPPHYQRKQTIAGGERYITPELKQHESRILHAQERIAELEYELFLEVRRRVAEAAGRLKAAARLAAELDVYAGLAELAAAQGYARPQLDTSYALEIEGGRHPVVEQARRRDRFVPNDTQLDGRGKAIMILTGPNMGGKSTYLRQVGLIVLLAHCGSFVPAESARIGVVDRMFCRVGASDALAEGQSTFMVEMCETAHILHHATPRSLVLLDEIGRGTATFDGLSIAWAVVEYLHGRPGGPPRTLFASHYHELTELAVELPQVANFRMAVRETGGRVVFLHKVEPGSADRSYGIHVARLAGVPEPVIRRAREILANLERDEYGRDGLPRRARRARQLPAAQPTLFGNEDGGERTDPLAAEILAELRQQDPDRLTPLEALEKLALWKRRLDQGGTP